ncbi:MAG: acetate/propionate family kinase, partial [Candidatus Woesearchaeota archaeon]
ELDLIAHRVVHGGEKYRGPCLINQEVIDDVKSLSRLAPLHNPPNLAGILACKKLFPKAKQYAVFDTAFHHTIPKHAFLYGIPIELYEKYGIRKYGFHGISHEYVSQIAAGFLMKKDSKIISCHLGNGSSITAIHSGESIDTSMGFTPLDGLIMGTRSGDIDPEIILYLLGRKHYSIAGLEDLLNKKSGMKAICGFSDMREVRDAALKGSKNARLAIDMLAYRIAFYIGGYAAALDGVDAIVFTGGIGENAAYLRTKVCQFLSHLGVLLDEKENKYNRIIISSSKSETKVYVIPTNEELMIVKKVKKII